MEFSGLTPDARRHGVLTLQLIANWSSWIKRRTETIQFVTDAAVGRHVSVDFVLRENLLRQPFENWGGTGMHYLPLAMLEKQPLNHFSLRDEADSAVPRLTRGKTADIACAALATLAQSVVAKHLRVAARVESRYEHFDRVRARDLALPEELERELWDLAYLRLVDREARRHKKDPPDAKTIHRSFTDFVDADVVPPLPHEWSWSPPAIGAAPQVWTSQTDANTWKAILIRNDEFNQLAHGFARAYLLSVPIEHCPEQRRVIKYSYEEPIREPILALWHRTKTAGPARRAFARLRAIEDRLEGLPIAEDPFEEWDPIGEDQARDTIRVRTKMLRAAGWHAKSVKFATPAVGWGGSYHCELVAPEGVQIRRAELNAQGSSGSRGASQRAVRGARSIERAQLYLSSVELGRAGEAEVALKARASTIVRAAASTAALLVGALVLTFANLGQIQESENGRLEVAAAVLLLAPGVLSIYMTRGGEHAMTTNVLYGLRILALASAFWAVSAAGLTILGPANGVRLVLWIVLICLAALTAAVLMVAWRLAARGRPLEQALTAQVGGP